MGIGWSYFINICQTLRVLIGLAVALVGCIAAYMIFSVVTQQMQGANPQPLVTMQPSGTVALPSGVSNPQFTSKSGPVAPALPSQPAGQNGLNVNPQFAPGLPSTPAGSVPSAPTGTPGLTPGPPPSSTGKNPQFGR